MLDLGYVRSNLDVVTAQLARRGHGMPVERFRELEEARRKLVHEADELRASRNKESEAIARAKRAGQDPSDRFAALREVSQRIKDLEARTREAEERLHDLLLSFPNLPDAAVPEGRTSDDNPVLREVGEKPTFDFEPRPHWEVGPALGILDFERAAKVAGARFTVSFGEGARLERALINIMLDVHTRERGYTEVLPPFMANSLSMMGTGQLPKFAEDLFHVENTDLYLVPTAEVPVTNLHREEILDGARLPISYTAYTPCFRSEAGSYGKDVRGMIRQHQFNKVELVKFTRPEDSAAAHEQLTGDAEEILKRLDLPYRVVELCTGDLGFAAARTYDLEVWLPPQGEYREISSCSNFTDFQARRAGIRFRRAPKSKPEFVHTLNGSGLAVGRTVAAILENYQRSDGSVSVPEVLQPYMGGLDVLKPPSA
jgi:seryl-tRNA synthetase